MYRVRIDYKPDFDFLKLIGEDLFDEAKELLIVHHVLPHGNPHYHVYVNIDVKENTIRQRIKRKGFVASEFSLKQCDPQRKDEYIQYLFNEKHGNQATVIFNRDIDSEYLHRLQIQAKDVTNEFAHRQTRKRPGKLTIYELAEEVHKKIQEHVGPVSIKEYVKVSIDICIKHKQAFEEHYLRRLAFTAMAMSNDEWGRRNWIASLVVEKIMPRQI